MNLYHLFEVVFDVTYRGVIAMQVSHASITPSKTNMIVGTLQ